MKTFILGFAGLIATGLAANAGAAKLDVTVTNLTQNIVFTPLFIEAHSATKQLFSLGEMASPELQMMAEGGALDGLVAMAMHDGTPTLVNMASGPLMPSTSAMAKGFDVGTQTHLSLTAMLLPTNDGFVGLDTWPIPAQPGTYTVWLNGYDAGTEANDERVVDGGGAPGTPGIPAAPLYMAGTGGTGVTSETPNMVVHIHPGNLGDDSMTGGKSDLTNTVHRWLNPVAKLTVVVH